MSSETFENERKQQDKHDSPGGSSSAAPKSTKTYELLDRDSQNQQGIVELMAAQAA